MSIEYTVTDRVALITLNSPERRNALTLDSSAQLAARIAEAETDEDVHAVVVTGAGKAFCAGAELSTLGTAHEDGLRTVYAGFLALAQCSLPTIAAVNGAAVGAGLNLALGADVRIAGPHARFDARFLRLGLHPGGGMTWMAQRAIGPQNAKAMTLFGDVLDAERAVQTGLAYLRAEDAVAAAFQLASAAADTSRELLITTKRTMRATAVAEDHAAAVDLEIGPQIESVKSTEFVEKLAAMQKTITSRT